MYGATRIGAVMLFSISLTAMAVTSDAKGQKAQIVAHCSSKTLIANKCALRGASAERPGQAVASAAPAASYKSRYPIDKRGGAYG
jgi:hypothetical protein